jgi:hypothetical protein
MLTIACVTMKFVTSTRRLGGTRAARPPYFSMGEAISGYLRPSESGRESARWSARH